MNKMSGEMGRRKRGCILNYITENTSLDKADIRNLGNGFYYRLGAIRRQMARWNEEGYSFRQIATWNTEEYKKESKIPRRQIKMFWREVELLKRIVLLAEFCKANGLDFQTEFEKHKIDIHHEQALNKLMENF